MGIKKGNVALSRSKASKSYYADLRVFVKKPAARRRAIALWMNASSTANLGFTGFGKSAKISLEGGKRAFSSRNTTCLFMERLFLKASSLRQRYKNTGMSRRIKAGIEAPKQYHYASSKAIPAKWLWGWGPSLCLASPVRQAQNIPITYSCRTMIDAVLKNSESIAKLCRLHGVTKLELFGSAARESDFDPATSDLDFAVEFAPTSPGIRFRELLSLQDELSSLFSRKVDLVEIKDVKNPYVLRTILEDKRPVYVAA